MNDAHFHLVVNHLPIIFPLIGIIVLITGLIFKSDAVKRTAFMIFILGSLSAIIAMSTGEDAEVFLETINDISEKFIKNHEETAETFALMSYLLGGLSLVGLWSNFKQKSFSNTISITVMVFAIVVLYFAQKTGTSGGEIRHTEIRNENLNK
ncbi:hypothetical protein [Flavobacterium sp.]|uniref:hypothetical protein n=1 Tax=Flavobacterium sp. TaxID=239 RepID=UPI0037533974